MLIGKILCIFIAIWFTMVNGLKSCRGQAIPAINFMVQAAGITGFVTLQWLV